MPKESPPINQEINGTAFQLRKVQELILRIAFEFSVFLFAIQATAFGTNSGIDTLFSTNRAPYIILIDKAATNLTDREQAFFPPQTSNDPPPIFFIHSYLFSPYC